MSDHHRHLLNGTDLADSITIDPHKWLAMPFAAGLLLTRHQPLLEQTFAVSTSYMPQRSAAELAHEPEDTRPVDYYRVSTQWSRRMNSLKLWLTLRVHGRQAYEQLIDRQFELADFMERAMLATGLYEKAVDRTLPILNLSLRHIAESDLAAAHAAIVDELTRDGAQWISHTTVNGRSVLRMMIISYLTEEQHVRQLAASMERAAKRVLEQHSVRA
jgi:aromatic-L-amino-acid decarboxylase